MKNNTTLGEPALSEDHKFLVIIKDSNNKTRKRKDPLGESGCPCAHWWRRVTQETLRNDMDARQNILLSEVRFRQDRD